MAKKKHSPKPPSTQSAELRTDYLSLRNPNDHHYGPLTPRTPPKKRQGQAAIPRSINGMTKDTRAIAALLGTTEKKIRSAVSRGLLPYRRWGGRIIFLEVEVMEFLKQLPGTTTEQALENVTTRTEHRQ